jgi:hypothetical protein
MKKNNKRRRFSASRLTFVSTPMVREYFGDAPVRWSVDIRENLNVSPSAMESTEIQRELEVREVVEEAKHMSSGEKADKVETLWREELENELISYDFPPPTTNMPRQQLVARLNLIKRVMPRANLYVLRGVLVTEYTNAQLQEQLLHYREAVHGTNACATRAQYEDRLVAALLKDSSGKTGNGYDHGQRFMSVEEELDDMDHEGLRAALVLREVVDIPRSFEAKYQKLTELMEEEHEELLESAVEVVVEDELRTRNLPFTKSDMVRWIQRKIKQDKAAAIVTATAVVTSSAASTSNNTNLDSNSNSSSAKSTSAPLQKVGMSGRKRRRGDDQEHDNVEQPQRVATPARKRRRVGVVVSSPSAESGNQNVPTANASDRVVVTEIQFPDVKSWKKLLSKQLQLELLLPHFDNRNISFDVSWNDLPSYHSSKLSSITQIGSANNMNNGDQEWGCILM